jgi:TRAP transporter TAXI family solute receptor
VRRRRRAAEVTRRALALIAAFALLAIASAQAAAPRYKIVTASERGTYIQIGRDLARFVAPMAELDLDVLPSAGSAANVRRLRFEPGVKFAIVQSDVFQAFLDQASAGNAEAASLIRPLRVMLPLYMEEIYFVVRADSPLEFVHEIEGARLNIGPIGSGTALTATTLYRAMFGAPIAEERTSVLSNEDALVKLITDRSLDVVAIVAGQPAKLLADMKPESRRYVKLLKFDRDHVTSLGALATYFHASVRADSYPNLLAEDIPALAVKAYLVTYDFNLRTTQQHLVRFARSLCATLPMLRARGHAKWREVELELPSLGKGWSYYAPVERELRACATEASARAKPARTCRLEERILGLCE